MTESPTTWQPEELINMAEIALREIRKYDHLSQQSRTTYTGQLVEKALLAISDYKSEEISEEKLGLEVESLTLRQAQFLLKFVAITGVAQRFRMVNAIKLTKSLGWLKREGIETSCYTPQL
jgi:hypothetical protein